MKKLILAILLVLLAACGETIPAPENTTDVQPTNSSYDFINPGYQEIMISNFYFTPKSVTIYQGDRVKWINDMQFVKRVWLWGMEPSPVINPGKAWSYVFTETGFYEYRDFFTQDMEGNVTVLPYEDRPDLQIP